MTRARRRGAGSRSAWGSGAAWCEKKKLTAPDATRGDYFGVSVSISGDFALAGASFDDENGWGIPLLEAHRTASSIESTWAVVRLRTVQALLRQTTAQAPHPWQRAALTVASFFQGCSARAS